MMSSVATTTPASTKLAAGNIGFIGKYFSKYSLVYVGFSLKRWSASERSVAASCQYKTADDPPTNAQALPSARFQKVGFIAAS